MLNRIFKYIRKYKIVEKGDKIVLAISGGKDSIFMLKLFEYISNKIELDIKLLHLDLGIKNYSNVLRKFIEKTFRKTKFNWEIIDLSYCNIEFYDFIEKGRKIMKGKSVCGICSIIKRYCFLKYTKDIGFNSLSTAHTLDDLARLAMSYYLEGNKQAITRITPVNYNPILKLKVIKPLFLVKEKDILDYLNKNKINYFDIPCPFSRKRESNLLKLIYTSEHIYPSFMKKVVLNFYKNVYLKEGIKFINEKLTKCKLCGMPSINKVCLFCKIKNGFHDNTIHSFDNSFSIHSNKNSNNNN